MFKYFRYLIAALFLFFSATIGQIFALLRPFNPSNLFYFARLISFGVKIMGIKLKVTGEENCHKEGTAVYISNHQHNLDVFICSSFLPKRTVSLGKKALLYIPFFGTFYALTGNILINRKNKSKAYKTLDKALIALTQENTSIWIMPEGTRSGTQDILPFKKGAFLLAIDAGVPIIPVSISSYHKFLNFNKLNAGKVYAQIHKPIDTKNFSKENYNKLLDQCYKVIKDGHEELNKMIEKKI